MCSTEATAANRLLLLLWHNLPLTLPKHVVAQKCSQHYNEVLKKNHARAQILIFHFNSADAAAAASAAI